MKKEELKFRKVVWAYWREHGRHDLPWRKTSDPYKILVSEVMLQQTQVERVIPFYKEFVKKFPTARKLAEAPLSEVLRAWQGLGYNRRAKMLHQAAKELSARRGGAAPHTAIELEQLPGVGPYTARAVAAFAWNEPGVVIETNIRTAAIHHFFPKREKVSDEEIEEVLVRAFPKGKAREWYGALMDYGASLKRTGASHNTRVKGYVKQSVFEGSLRQARGAILAELVRAPRSGARLLGLLGDARREQSRTALAALVAEGLVTKQARTYSLPR